MSRQMKVALNLLTLVENPSFGTAGDIYFNTLTKNLRIYNGIDWVELTPPSTDPTPFYMHTHTFDGDVHTIDVQNKVTFMETNLNNSPETSLPIIIGYDGKYPGSPNDSGTFKDQTLLDGGNINDIAAPSGDEILEGGSSSENDGIIVDGGSSI